MRPHPVFYFQEAGRITYTSPALETLDKETRYELGHSQRQLEADDRQS